MMLPPSSVCVWLAAGASDMRRGMNGLALQVQQALGRNPHGGDVFVFRGKRGDLVKVLWHDGLGMSLYAKRLGRGRFVWPTPTDGAVCITWAQLGYMLEGIDLATRQRRIKHLKFCKLPLYTTRVGVIDSLRGHRRRHPSRRRGAAESGAVG